MEVAGLETVQHDVSGPRHLKQLLAAAVRFNVDDDARLVGVVGEPTEAAVKARFVTGERRHMPDGVAARRLDLDDLRAQVCQQAARVLSGQP